MEDKEIKLHIGCGKKNFGDDWIHIDGSKYDHIKYHNITKLYFPDDSVDLIYACHVLEYFDREEVIIVLKEWRRVLKIGGVLRLAVPDFEMMSKLYSDNIITLDNIIGPIFGKWKMTDKETIFHKTVYDFKSLEKILKISEFSNIKLWDWRTTEHSQFDDYSQAYIPHMDKENGTLISLNVECKKM